LQANKPRRFDLSISVRNVSSLSHEVLDYSVKLRTLIRQLAVASSAAGLARAKSLLRR
jgi:hypothetical protein